MSRKVSLLVFICGLTTVLLGIRLGAQAQAQGQAEAQAVKGLEMSVSKIARTDTVSLGDCPATANSVRGVIRPGDDREYATVTIDVNVTSSFDAAAIVRPPTLTDADGKTYRTAQAFTGTGTPETYSCDFSFRVPKGMSLTTLAVEDATFDLSVIEQ